MIRPLLAALFLLLLPAVAHAQCNPVNSPTQSPGCWPQASSISGSTDYLLGWQPGQFPASAVRIPANLIPGIGILPLANGGTGQSQPFGRTATTFARGDYVAPSLLSFGAKCDGTTDDSMALSAALATGTPITIPANATCVIGSAAPITIGDVNVSLTGYSRDSVLRFTGANGGIIWNPTGANRKLQISNVTFITTQANGGNAITLHGNGQLIESVLIDNIWITGATPDVSWWSNGIVGSNIGNLEITSSELDGAGWSYYEGYNGDAILLTASGLSTAAAQVQNIHDNEIFNWMRAFHASTSGDPGMEGILLRNNQLVGAGTPVQITTDPAYRPPGILISGNALNSNLGPDIALNGFAQIQLTDNGVYDQSPSHITMTGSISSSGVLTVSSITGFLAAGMEVQCSGCASGTQILSQLTGTGWNTGTYQTNAAAAVSSQSMTADAPAILLSNITEGDIKGNFLYTNQSPYQRCISLRGGTAGLTISNNTFAFCSVGIDADSTTQKNIIGAWSDGGGNGVPLLSIANPATSLNGLGNIIAGVAALWNYDPYGHPIAVGYGTPTLSACPAGATIFTGSTDMVGLVSWTSPGTSCTINFSHAWPAAPYCMLTANNGVLQPFLAANSTTSITIGTTSSAGGVGWDCKIY